MQIAAGEIEVNAIRSDKSTQSIAVALPWGHSVSYITHTPCMTGEINIDLLAHSIKRERGREREQQWCCQRCYAPSIMRCVAPRSHGRTGKGQGRACCSLLSLGPIEKHFRKHNNDKYFIVMCFAMFTCLPPRLGHMRGAFFAQQRPAAALALATIAIAGFITA